ncbi:MAG: cytochrome b [Gammaproteobacteria bacterium]|nr:cytochrome b [Gammaproteobacteria bacterium]
MSTSYSKTARRLHWIIAVLVILQFIFIFTAEGLPREHELRGLFFQLHFSTGFTVLLLAVWRVINRFTNPPPMPEQGMSRAVQLAAATAHWAMYAAIFILPVTGLMLVNTRGSAVGYFWLFDLPMIVGESDDLHELVEAIHVPVGIGLLALASLHALAALWHHFIRKDDTLRRMLGRG